MNKKWVILLHLCTYSFLFLNSHHTHCINDLYTDVIDEELVAEELHISIEPLPLQSNKDCTSTVERVTSLSGDAALSAENNTATDNKNATNSEKSFNCNNKNSDAEAGSALRKNNRNMRKYTIITYMSADNDLAPFARKNLKQQTDVGSTPFVHLFVQLDTRVAGNKKITRRYYVEKNKLIITNQNDVATEHMDSGDPHTLIDCCRSAITAYPAEEYILILWNHGTGALDIGTKKTINPFPLFVFNPNKNIIELDRSIPFLDYVQMSERAICFDDTTGHCLSNSDLVYALDTITKEYLGGKKFKLICFDACLMSMIEIADIIKEYADYMTASQEVVLGPGYNYEKMLEPFTKNSLDPKTLARHIVQTYEQTYNGITNDFTQSAIKLDLISLLSSHVDNLAQFLVTALKKQKNNSVTEAIKASRNRLFCTHFDEPSYIDLHHFCRNLIDKCQYCVFMHPTNGTDLIESIKKAARSCIESIERAVIAKTVGKNLSKAQGVSIYFPEKKLHTSYHKTPFAQRNSWYGFICQYLLSL